MFLFEKKTGMTANEFGKFLTVVPERLRNYTAQLQDVLQKIRGSTFTFSPMTSEKQFCVICNSFPKLSLGDIEMLFNIPHLVDIYVWDVNQSIVSDLSFGSGSNTTEPDINFVFAPSDKIPGSSKKVVSVPPLVLECKFDIPVQKTFVRTNDDEEVKKMRDESNKEFSLLFTRKKDELNECIDQLPINMKLIATTIGGDSLLFNVIKETLLMIFCAFEEREYYVEKCGGVKLVPTETSIFLTIQNPPTFSMRKLLFINTHFVTHILSCNLYTSNQERSAVVDKVNLTIEFKKIARDGSMNSGYIRKKRQREMGMSQY